nr:MAG TPA: hypothetical protein [Caudoviricetes sp.]
MEKLKQLKTALISSNSHNIIKVIKAGFLRLLLYLP